MPPKNQAAVDFLLSRRSRPAKTLTGPAPTREELDVMLTAAARTPDHGKLEPWRFVVLTGAALPRLASLVGEIGQNEGRDADAIAKAQRQYADAELAVAVISAPVQSEKVPEIEQVYSAGAVCLALLNVALASGWGANWLSGWASHSAQFRAAGLGLDEGERIAGLIHIGTETVAAPERPRPDVAAKTTWMDA